MEWLAAAINGALAEKAFALVFAFTLLKLLHDDLGAQTRLLGLLADRTASNEAAAIVRHAELQGDVRALTRAVQQPRRVSSAPVAGGSE